MWIGGRISTACACLIVRYGTRAISTSTAFVPSGTWVHAPRSVLMRLRVRWLMPAPLAISRGNIEHGTHGTQDPPPLPHRRRLRCGVGAGVDRDHQSNDSSTSDGRRGRAGRRGRTARMGHAHRREVPPRGLPVCQGWDDYHRRSRLAERLHALQDVPALVAHPRNDASRHRLRFGRVIHIDDQHDLRLVEARAFQ